MEEDHSTPSSHTLLHMAAGLLPMAAAPLSLLLFTFSHTLCTPYHSLNLALKYKPPLYAFLSSLLQHIKGTMGPEIMPLIVALVMLPLSHN
jgi:hypothetical protein